ncbi:REP-associated tyrosine transposase [Chitinilyticum litopenaei]|uniref:REP-associated tyrosine transposase n=1 Tax=Chitinilyticum litopenaei TaxID=1121276 RepID=UPI0004233E42|nr:transposase [Chitinilyticum litopenaei]
MGEFHACNLRKGRYSQNGQIYLLTSITAERTPLFSDWRVGRLLVNELRMSKVDTLAFVIMPDHLHWLCRLEQQNLSAVIQAVKSRSAIMINRHRRGAGKVWQPGFHDHALRAEEDVLSVARYVVANPLRAGIVERLGDYPLWDACWL